MNVPGDNLLSMAMELIEPQSVNYFQFQSRTTNAAGDDLDTYYPFVTIDTGSVQPVNRALYQKLGLDWAKTYITWFVPDIDAVDIARDTAGDTIEFANRRFKLSGGAMDWFNMDGWKSIMGVDIGQATGALTNA